MNRRQQQTEAIRAMKNSPCVDCGGAFHHSAMDFDHRDRSDKFRKVSSMGQRSSWESVLLEVAKCDLVCACCHRLRTYKGDTSYHTRRWGHHRAVVDALKAMSSCADCGRKMKPCQMDFDHLGHKTTNVSWLLGAPKDKLLAEIAVCHIVCNCHRVRSSTGQRCELTPTYSDRLIELFNEIAMEIEYPRDERLSRPWHGIVGTMTDAKVAEMAGVTRSAVSMHRRKMGTPSFRSAQGSL